LCANLRQPGAEFLRAIQPANELCQCGGELVQVATTRKSSPLQEHSTQIGGEIIWGSRQEHPVSIAGSVHRPPVRLGPIIDKRFAYAQEVGHCGLRSWCGIPVLFLRVRLDKSNNTVQRSDPMCRQHLLGFKLQRDLKPAG
jgi:hypothetical protein